MDRYRQVESMLYEYNQRVAKVKMLEIELEQIDEMISLGSPILDDLPHGTDITDPTAKTALKLQENKEELLKKKGSCERFIKRLDKAIGLLPRTEFLVIKRRYILDQSWQDISIFMGFSQGHCKRIRRKGIEHLIYLLSD